MFDFLTFSEKREKIIEIRKKNYLGETTGHIATKI